MTDLTSQWHKGELPEETECYVRVNGGIYLGSIRYKNGCHNKKLPYIKSFNGQFITKHVEEVLAEVPDYVEWRNMVNCACEEHEANKRLLEENAQLKEKIERLEKQYDRAKWWLNEIVKNHRFTPISTAEKALKDLSELEK